MRNLMETNQNTSPAWAPAPGQAPSFLEFLRTPIGRLVQIELLVIVTASLLLFLVIFGSCRRRWNSDMFRVIIFTAYTLSTYVLTYALGLMHEAPVRNELFPIWALFLMIVLGSADSLSAYSLEDNEQWKNYNWQLVIKGIWLALLLGLYIPGKSNTMVTTYCLIFILIVKADERARALMAASQHSLQKNTKVVADFMSVEHTEDIADYLTVKPTSCEQFDPKPNDMTGCHYLVRGEEEIWVKDVFLPSLRCKRPRKEKVPAWERKYRTPCKNNRTPAELPCQRPASEGDNPRPASEGDNRRPASEGDHPRSASEGDHPRPASEEDNLRPSSGERPASEGDDLITIQKVWECKGQLLSREDPKNKLKDICLAFALFKLLRLRYAGYSLPLEAHEKTRKLISNGLLRDHPVRDHQVRDHPVDPVRDDRVDYKRAFRVVDLELGFLFDFFYTKYGIIFQPSRLWLKFLESVTVAVGIWAATSILKDYKRLENNDQLATLPNGLSVEELVTGIMIILFITVELVQFLFMCFSDWAKVIWICKYVQNDSWHNKEWIETIIKRMCSVQLLRPWEQKLHQYSFLESYSHKSFRLLNNVTMAAYIDQIRDGQKQSPPIDLTDDVKQTVFEALRSNCENSITVENGQALLSRSSDSERLLWACEFETQTQVIMVWHIATSFCEHHDRLQWRESDSREIKKHLDVATSLSKYLAYLVAFAPRLLPDHPYVAEYVFDQVIIEAEVFFKSCKNMGAKIEKMKIQSPNEDRVIYRGVQLGNQLAMIENKETIWEILAGFWVQQVLYVAPSDDVKAHAMHLTRGGEFVTHVWALLSHAGIKRAPKSMPNEETSKAPSTEVGESSGCQSK